MTQPSEDVRRSWHIAQALRQPYEAEWQRLVDVAMPGRTSFHADPSGQGPTNAPPIYDDTGQVAISEMASRLQSGLLPQGVNWAVLEGAPDLMPDTLAGIEAVQAELFEILSRSNMEGEANDAFKDLSGFGNCCLALYPGDWYQPIRFQAFSLADVWITPGIYGTWADIHVRHRLPGYVIRQQWPHAELPKGFEDSRDTTLHPVIESWLRDRESNTERWTVSVHLAGTHELTTSAASGAGSCPYQFGRWSKAAGDLYGHGQGMLALPSMRTVNEAVRLILVHGDMALSGMWQAEDDGVLNPWSVQLVPGAIIPKAPGSAGLTPLALPGTRLDIGQLVLEDQRHNIRKTLFNEQLGPRQGTPTTATEIQERMNELARAIGPAYGRVWNELVVPVLSRALRILRNQGRIILPDVDGRTVKVVPASAFVRAAAAGEVNRVVSYAQAVAALFGPQAVQSMLDPETFKTWAAERIGVPRSLLLSDAKLQAMTQQAGQVAAQAGAGDPSAQALAPLMAAMGGS